MADNDETPLEQAHRHIAIGEALIAKQEAIIKRLHAAGHPTTGPEQILVTLEQTLTLMYQHLAHEQLHALSST